MSWRSCPRARSTAAPAPCTYCSEVKLPRYAMIPRRIWPWMLLAACWANPSPAVDTFDLFTASEAAQWNAERPKEPTDFSTRDLADDNGAPTCHSTPDNDADNPQIRILTPPLGKTLSPPLDMDLLFVPTASAPIRPDSFRVC